jgi:hypothetical protein
MARELEISPVFAQPRDECLGLFREVFSWCAKRAGQQVA